MDNPELPEMPKTEDEKTKELEVALKKIEELEITLSTLDNFSNQVRFNSVIYQGISLIIDKLNKIESELNKFKPIKNEKV